MAAEDADNLTNRDANAGSSGEGDVGLHDDAIRLD
jgi:hypothetical protein